MLMLMSNVNPFYFAMKTECTPLFRMDSFASHHIASHRVLFTKRTSPISFVIHDIYYIHGNSRMAPLKYIWWQFEPLKNVIKCSYLYEFAKVNCHIFVDAKQLHKISTYAYSLILSLFAEYYTLPDIVNDKLRCCEYKASHHIDWTMYTNI